MLPPPRSQGCPGWRAADKSTHLRHPMASWFRKRKKKAPEPLLSWAWSAASARAAQAVPEERSRTAWARTRLGSPAHSASSSRRRCRRRSEQQVCGSRARASRPLGHEGRIDRLRCIPTTRMIQVNLRSTNTRVVRRSAATPEARGRPGARGRDPRWPAAAMRRDSCGTSGDRRGGGGAVLGRSERTSRRWTLRWYNKSDPQPCGPSRCGTATSRFIMEATGHRRRVAKRHGQLRW